MLIIPADFDRRIDLPGAGPCPRPVDIDRSRTGFGDLVSLRIYSFARGVVIDGEAEGDEVFIVLMRGAADIAISRSGRQLGAFSLQAEGMRALYMPPHASYQLTAVADCDIAYARTEPVRTDLPQVRAFVPTADRLDVAGYATGMDLTLRSLLAGEDVELGKGGHLPERFVHVRGAEEMTAIIDGATLKSWDSAALDEDESVRMTIKTGAADVLTISASRNREAAENAATDETS